MVIRGPSGISFSANAGSTQHMRLTSTGNLGIGITPSSWGTFNAAQVGLLSLASYTNGDTDISSNLYYNAGWKYIGTGRSAQIKLDSSTGGGDIKFLVDATGGTAGGATAGTEAARIGSDGSFLVGTTTNAGAGFVSATAYTPKVTTYAGLPASPPNGTRCMISNGLSNTFNAVAAGGGSNVIPVYYVTSTGNWYYG